MVLLPLGFFCRFRRAIQQAGERPGEKVAAHLETRREDSQASQQNPDDGSFGSDVNQDGAFRPRGGSLVGCEESIGGSRYFAQILLFQTETQDALPDVPLLASGNPKSLPVKPGAARTYEV